MTRPTGPVRDASAASLGGAGAAPDDSGPLFAALDRDPHGSLDEVHDENNMPLDGEPQRVRDDRDAVRARASA
ncbi:hypothetical protein [Streptomyces sp. NPDC001286]